MPVAHVGDLITAAKCIQHGDDRVSAKAKDMRHAPAFKIINNLISDKFFHLKFSSLRNGLYII